MLSRLSIQTKYAGVFLLTLALVVAGVLIGVDSLGRRQLKNEAVAVAEQVIAFRAWVATTGVVWVDHTTPNFPDYLGRRNGVDGNGNALEFSSKNPALATRELSEIANKSSTRATFRVTSDEYRNPANMPDTFESTAISMFKKDKDLKNYDVIERGYYRYSQPIYVQQACLKCHGDPKDAPADVIQKYGDQRAFGYKVGDVRGIISVKLPNVTLSEIFMTLLNPYSVGLVVFAFLLNFLYAQRGIIARLKRLAKSTEAIASGSVNVPLPTVPGSRDEVDHVAHTVDLLRNSVLVAMKRLQKQR
jgi:HAMP domain-containing protein